MIGRLKVPIFREMRSFTIYNDSVEQHFGTESLWYVNYSERDRIRQVKLHVAQYSKSILLDVATFESRELTGRLQFGHKRPCASSRYLETYNPLGEQLRRECNKVHPPLHRFSFQLWVTEELGERRFSKLKLSFVWPLFRANWLLTDSFSNNFVLPIPPTSFSFLFRLSKVSIHLRTQDTRIF